MVFGPTTGATRLHLRTGNTERLTITSGGDIGIGTTVPTAKLSVNGTANKPGGGSWAVFSDRRIKKDIAGITSGLDVIMRSVSET